MSLSSAIFFKNNMNALPEISYKMFPEEWPDNIYTQSINDGKDSNIKQLSPLVSSNGITTPEASIYSNLHDI